MTSSTDFTLQIEIIQGCQMEENKGPIGCDAHSSFESGRQRPNGRISTGVHSSLGIFASGKQFKRAFCPGQKTSS